MSVGTADLVEEDDEEIDEEIGFDEVVELDEKVSFDEVVELDEEIAVLVVF